ncbi:MAG: class F sortase [Chloroflexi bacterium]|nr:class F sortase [Chloroflexota bacterium]
MAGSPTRLPWGLSTILGGLLLTSGVLFLAYSVATYFELTPGSKVVVPKPVALEQPRPTATPAPPTPTLSTGPTAVPTMRPAPTRATQNVVTAKPTLRPVTGAMLAPPAEWVYATPMPVADADDRPYWGTRPRPGMATHLEIPTIDLATDVTEGGVITNKQGQLEWQTVPFIAVQYREMSPVGAQGNAVISGHVVTIAEGNVFRNLYKVNIGDEVQVVTADGHFTYTVDDVKLVKPNNIEVMSQSPNPMLTLITCGGEFDTKSRTFSDRLIVTSRLTDWQRNDATARAAESALP